MDNEYLELISLYGEQSILAEKMAAVDSRIAELEAAAKETVKVISGNSPPTNHRGTEQLRLIFERKDGRVFVAEASKRDFYEGPNGDMLPYLKVSEMVGKEKVITNRWDGGIDALWLFIALR